MGEFVVQVSVKGIDEGGREVMWNVAGKTSAEFDAEYTKRLPTIKSLKPLPIKQYGGSGGKPRKEIKPLPDAPMCPTHNKPMNPKKWSPKDEPAKVMYFWTCGEKTNGEYCKEKLSARPTVEQYVEWCKINEMDTESTPTTPQAKPEQNDKPSSTNGTDWLRRGNVIAGCKSNPFWNGNVQEIVTGLVFLESKNRINATMVDVDIVSKMNEYARYLADKQAQTK